MKKSIVIMITFFGLLSCNNNKTNKKFDEHSYQEQKINLLDKERNNPITFLKLE